VAEQQQDRDQRTEQATPQRLQKAREEGQLGFSSELVGGVILLTVAGLYWLVGDWFFAAVLESLRVGLTQFEMPVDDPRMLIEIGIEETLRVGAVVMAVIAPIGMLAAVSGLLQTNFNVSFKPLELKVDRLSVVSGFKRIFSMQSAVRGGLSIIKAALILCVSGFVAKAKLTQIATSGFGSFQELMYFLGGLLIHCSLAIAATMTVVGVIDLGFQKWKHLEDMKMSRRDLKDEQKDTEGDPMIRARIKQIQAEMGRKRMLADVPKATVVVTNPTHFAVALRYESGETEAPVVIAKGADFLAKRIIEVAKENGVPVVERKPIARFLYKNVDIGHPIPLELYQAVAEILNFVNRMRSAV